MCVCVCVCVCERERGYGHDTVTNMQDAYSLPQKCSLGQPKPDDNVTHLYGCTGGLLSSGRVGNPVSFRRSEGVHALHESPSEGAALQHARNVSKRETKRRKMATNRQRQPPFWVEVTSEFRNLGRPTTKRATKIDRLNPTIACGADPPRVCEIIRRPTHLLLRSSSLTSLLYCCSAQLLKNFCDL